MGRNLFSYALLGGIAKGADTYAQGLAEEQRAARELEQRKALLEMQNEAFAERRGLVPGVAGGTTGARTAQSALFNKDDAQARQDYATAPVTDEEVQRIDPTVPRRIADDNKFDQSLAPGQAGPVRPATGQDGGPPKMVLDRNSPLFKDAERRIRSIREALAIGPGNYDELQKGRQTETENNLLVDASRGSQGARDAILVGKGKDPRETVARADERTAEADKDRRTDPNRRAGGAAPKPTGPKPVTGVDLDRAARAAEKDLANELGVPTSRVNEELARLNKNGKLTPAQKAAADRWRSALQEVQKLNRSPGAAAPAPAQSGAPKKDHSNLW
jgi:hypothetical protein